LKKQKDALRSLNTKNRFNFVFSKKLGVLKTMEGNCRSFYGAAALLPLKGRPFLKG
jgi:hypothetical protein